MGKQRSLVLHRVPDCGPDFCGFGACITRYRQSLHEILVKLDLYFISRVLIAWSAALIRTEFVCAEFFLTLYNYFLKITYLSRYINCIIHLYLFSTIQICTMISSFSLIRIYISIYCIPTCTWSHGQSMVLWSSRI